MLPEIDYGLGLIRYAVLPDSGLSLQDVQLVDPFPRLPREADIRAVALQPEILPSAVG